MPASLSYRHVTAIMIVIEAGFVVIQRTAAQRA
jgi:hypothetical protein